MGFLQLSLGEGLGWGLSPWRFVAQNLEPQPIGLV